jgi:hypothetical protein
VAQHGLPQAVEEVIMLSSRATPDLVAWQVQAVALAETNCYFMDLGVVAARAVKVARPVPMKFQQDQVFTMGLEVTAEILLFLPALHLPTLSLSAAAEQEEVHTKWASATLLTTPEAVMGVLAKHLPALEDGPLVNPVPRAA